MKEHPVGLEPADDRLKKDLKDPYFRELNELDQQKLSIVKPIIQYRVKHGMNQKQLAEKVGVTQQHISKIESGDFVSVLTLEKVLLAIGYTVQLRVVALRREVVRKIEQARSRTH